MHLPHSASGDVGPAAVLIPLRSLHAGKLRLAHSIDAADRARLIESMAERVVAAAGEIDVLIVHDDHEVAEWATERGALAFRPETPGLNRAVSEGRDHLAALGFNVVIVAHADLPRAVDLGVMLTDHPITVVPDRHGDGTNVLCVPTTIDFSFAYGPGSFAAHTAIARNLGIEPHVIDAPDLAWDVDHPDDLLTIDQNTEQ